MLVRRPYSKEASQYQRTNSLFGLGLSFAKAGLSVSFLDGQVILTNPTTGEELRLSKAEWASMSEQEKQSVLRSANLLNSPLPKEDEIGASLGGTPRAGILGGCIAVINSNSARDDNFNIYLNGSLLFATDFSEEGRRTYYACFGPPEIDALARARIEEDYGSVIYMQAKNIPRPDFAYPGGTGQFFFENTQANDNGNYGVITLTNFYIPSEPWDYTTAYLTYGPDDGEDQTITFTWTGPPT